MATPEAFFRSLPPITRGWLVAALLATVLSEFKFVPAMKLVWIPELSLPPHWEVWRLLTSFVFMGGFGMSFVINLLMISQFCPQYENNPFSTTLGAYAGGTPDFAFALLFCGAVLLLLGTYLGLYVLGPSLIATIIYLWSKRNPNAPINLWGFRMMSRHLPWARLALAVLMGASPVEDLVGIAAGHVYYFLVEVLPARYEGRRFLNTPEWLIHLVDYVNDTNTFHQVPPPRRAGAEGARPGAAVIPPRGPGHNWGAGQRLGLD